MRNKLISIILIILLINYNCIEVKAEPLDVLLGLGKGQLMNVEYDCIPIEVGIYDLGQAQLTKPYSLKGLLETENIKATVNWETIGFNRCGEKTGEDIDEIKDRYGNVINTIVTPIYCESVGINIVDSSLTVGVESGIASDMEKIIANKNGFKQRQPFKQVSRNGVASDSTEFIIDDYSFMLFRGEDDITFSKYTMSNNQKTEIKELFNNKIEYKPVNNRRDNGFYKDNLNLLLDKSTLSGTDYYTFGDRSCGHGGISGSNSRVIASPVLNKEMTFGVYKGTVNNTKSQTVGENKRLQSIAFGKRLLNVTGKGVLQSDKISFYPWIKMYYYIFTNDNYSSSDCLNISIKYADILGDYERSIIPTSYAEIGYYKDNTNNLVVKSDMWATNARAVKEKGSNIVLPGGATYSISDNGATNLVASTWQFIIPDGKNREAIEEVSGTLDYSIDTAENKHSEYINSIINCLETKNIELYVNGNKASTQQDSKYTIKNDSNANRADEGDLDLKEESTQKIYWKISSDTSGNILLGSGASINNISSKIILRKNQNIRALTDSEAIALNDRTKIIANYLGAIQRNMGYDKTRGVTWVNDGRWYNEAFEIYLIEQKTRIRAGLLKPIQRTFVLDPTLCTVSNSKADLYTLYNKAQLKLNDNKLVGYFDGNIINMQNIENMFTTQEFYIPNATVQDND